MADIVNKKNLLPDWEGKLGVNENNPLPAAFPPPDTLSTCPRVHHLQRDTADNSDIATLFLLLRAISASSSFYELSEDGFARRHRLGAARTQ